MTGMGKIDDLEIKKVNFIQGNSYDQNDGRDYLAEIELDLSTKKKAHRVITQPISTKLKVKIIAARDLSSSNLPDVSVMINLNGIVHSTSTIKKTLDPEWDSEYEFDINTNIFNELEVTVWDLTKQDKIFLGVVYFDLAKMDHQNELSNTIPHWYELKPRKWNEKIGGEICIQITRIGKKIPWVVPIRSRKNDVFDLELSQSEAESLLSPEDLVFSSKLKGLHNRGLELFEDLKFLTSDINQISEISKKRKRTFSKVSKHKVPMDIQTFRFDILPEEVLYRIFIYLTAMERATISLVCKDWHRIASDSSLKSPVLQILELIDREKKEGSGGAEKITLVSEICDKLKPFSTTLQLLSIWQTDTAQFLSPFPLDGKTKSDILLSYSMINNLVTLTHLAAIMDRWKNNLTTISRKLLSPETFKYFKTCSQIETEEADIYKLNLMEDCFIFLNNPTLKHFFGTRHLSAFVYISEIIIAQINRLKFTSLNELQKLIEFLATSVLWIFLNGDLDSLKKTHKFKMSKAIKLLKEYEDKIPLWIIATLSTIKNTKYKSKIALLVKGYSL